LFGLIGELLEQGQGGFFALADQNTSPIVEPHLGNLPASQGTLSAEILSPRT